MQTLSDRADGKIILPVGCTSLDRDVDWLLDSLDVPELLLRAERGERLDLTALCCRGSDVVRHVALQRTRTSRTTTRDDEEIIAATDEFERHGMASPTHLRAYLPSSVRLAQVEGQRLQEAAYIVFLYSCCDGEPVSKDLVQTLRTQLEIRLERADELAGAVAAAQGRGVTSLRTMSNYSDLLRVVSPTDFRSFKGFISWRRAISALISGSVRYTAEKMWTQGNVSNLKPAVMDGHGNAANMDGYRHSNSFGRDEKAQYAPTARKLVAKVSGHLRRLDYSDPEEFDPEEDAHAVEAISESVRAISAHCKQGTFTLPPGLAVQLAELLLRGLFDPLEEGQSSGEYDELLSVLQGRIWPLLSISPSVHVALFAWVHFCEFQRSREVSPLQSSADAVRRLQGRRSDPEEAPVVEAILEALSRESRACLSDRHEKLTSLQELQGMVALTESAEIAVGRRKELPGRLEECVRSNVSTSFSRQATSILESDDNMVSSLQQQPGQGGQTTGSIGDTPHFARRVSDASILSLTRVAEQILHEECSDFASMILSILPTARAACAAEIHRSFGSIFLPWLVALPAATPSALEAVCAARELEEKIFGEVSRAGASIDPWGIAERLEPLIYGWAQSQLQLLKEWVGRISADEDWSSASRGRAGASRSVVDIVKLVSDSMESLFGLSVEPPVGAVLCLVEGADALLTEFAQGMVRGLGSVEDTIPLPPPLTRFKKDLAQQAELTDMYAAQQLTSGTGSASSTPDAGRGKLRSFASGIRSNGTPTKSNGTVSNTSFGSAGALSAAGSSAWVQPLTHDQADRLFGPSYESLAVRANSMRYLADQLVFLKKRVIERWCQVHYYKAGSGSQTANDGASAVALGGRPDWATGLFVGGIEAAESSLEAVLRFSAIKVSSCVSSFIKTSYSIMLERIEIAIAYLSLLTFIIRSPSNEGMKQASLYENELQMICGDLRVPVFERLYLHHAESFTIAAILQGVDARLGNLCAHIREDMAGTAASQVCAVLAASIVHVLLDGGPWRLFTIGDIDVLRDDLMAVRATFHAEGAGISPETIEKLTAPIEEILTAMGLETPFLIDALMKARSQPLGNGISIIQHVKRDGGTANARSRKEKHGAEVNMNADVALRILCHRADHAASKFLKKEFKIPKKLSGGNLTPSNCLSRSVTTAFGIAGTRIGATHSPSSFMSRRRTMS